MSEKPEKQGLKKGRPEPPLKSRWKKGQSGNPKGRPPKELCLTSLVKAELELQAEQGGQLLRNKDGSPKTWAQILATAIVRQAARGNATALAQLWERLDGKIPQALEHQGPGGGPIEISTQRERLRKILADPGLKDTAIEIGKRLAALDLDEKDRTDGRPGPKS